MPALNRTTCPVPSLPIRVMQFGEGNFLRAFVDWMIDRLNKEMEFGAGVAVVQPIAQGLANLLNEQEGLYTLYLNGLKQGEVVSEHVLVDCIQTAINPYTDYAAYLALAENPDVEFVISNTTEAGIAFSEADQLTDAPPSSFPAKLTAWLHHRYHYFGGSPDSGVVVLPCELIDRNGDQLQQAVNQYIAHWNLDQDFADWVAAHVTFCNTLVDRIVPGYPRDKAAELCEALGYHDKLLVEAEQFHLWVIEGPSHVRERLPFEHLGLQVLFPPSMAPYRTRKVRILNGAHTAMVPLAYLHGLETVRETVEHPVWGKFVQQVVFEEIIPTLELPQAELESFANDVLDRFRNPYIHHLLHSISLNSMSKFETRVLPSLLEYHRWKGEWPRGLVRSLAALIRFYKGERNGQPYPLNDSPDVLSLYANLWAQYDGTPASLGAIVREVLGYQPVWKQDLNQQPGLAEAVSKELAQLMGEV